MSVLSPIETVLTAAQGKFVLNRFPPRPRERLRAWDAADEYLLDYLAENGLPSKESRILIANDSCGALAVALSQFQPHALTDSYLSQQATRHNLAANNLPDSSVKLSSSLEMPEGPFDLAVIKVPKTLALLEDELIRLRPHLTSASKVVVAGMVKNLPQSLWALLERLLGPATTSLARKKARLVFVQPDPLRAVPISPYPVYYRLENTDYLIANHANVFSRDSLDIGTRLFLQHLPNGLAAQEIVDLGCGNGVVGLLAAARNPAAVLHFTDESFMAVASARENFMRAFGNKRAAIFSVADGLTNFAPNSVDLILCNPPFHQQNAIADHIAEYLFKQSRNALRIGGELWVIGNRHLNYHIPLARLFGNYSVVAANAKFVISKVSKIGRPGGAESGRPNG